MDAYQTYLVPIFQEYCKDRTVLEIGSFTGYITEALALSDPAHLTCVEPNSVGLEILAKRKDPEANDCAESDGFSLSPIKIDEIHACTANDYFDTNPEPVDVVVCFGVLYHLHSPLQFLERMVNACEPEIVILEPLQGADQIEVLFTSEGDKKVSPSHYYVYEVFDIPGNAQSDRGLKKPLNMTLQASSSLFATAMHLLGYDYKIYDVPMSKFEQEGKSHLGVFLRRS